MQKLSLRPVIPAEKIGEYMRSWRDKMGENCKVYTIGVSGGYPITVAEMTDSSVPEDKKENVILTAQHAMELSGPNTIFSVGNYLANGGDQVREILRCQKIILVPCPNMFSYARQDCAYQFKNEAGIDEYRGFTDDMQVDKEKAPACYALKTLIDKYRPELFIDAHGSWYSKAGCMEVTGAYSFANLNYSYDRSFSDAMNFAAEREGYAVFSEDAQQMLRDMDPFCKNFPKRFRLGAPAMLAGIYAYIQYHTLSLNMEVTFEESGMIRIIEALKLGCKPIWHVNGIGYPVRVMRAHICSDSILCAGETAEERRESRCEIWQQADKIGHAILAPELNGLQGFFVTTDMQKAKTQLGNGGTHDLGEFFDKLELSGMDLAGVRTLFKDITSQCWVECSWGGAEESAKITHGYTMRIAMPFSEAVPKRVYFNGKLLSSAEYDIFHKGAFTYLEYTTDKTPPTFALLVVDYEYPQKRYGIVEFE